MDNATHGGGKYFVTSIDDKSHYTDTHVMAHKGEVFEKFKIYEAKVTNHTGKNIKYLRSDNGTEYQSKEFKKFCQGKGIVQQFTTLYTPEQNRVSERMNRTIVERARYMLGEANMSLKYWGEAVMTATYLINRCPTSANEGTKTPFELWHGAKPNLGHIRTFGCTVYAHIPEEKRKKFDRKTIKCKLLGYQNKEYRLVECGTYKVILSRDVVFDEALPIGAKSKVMGDEYTEGEEHKGVPIKKDESQNIETSSSAPTDEVSSPDVGTPSSADKMEDNKLGESSSSLTNEGEKAPSTLRRSAREKKPNLRYGVDANMAIVEPITLEALKTKEAVQWKAAADEEMNSLMENNTWDLQELPKGRKAIGNRWVFRVKHHADGSIERFKARLVAKGYSQKEGIDYDETFAPVAKFNSIRTILATAPHKDMDLQQMDVKTAFLNGDLNEVIYMNQPEGYEEPGQEHLVCKLKKGLYGLKQASRSWNEKIDSVFKEEGFKDVRQISVFM
jgi:Reverse transcriptase (RNA-dependent DNA polymerase)